MPNTFLMPSFPLSTFGILIKFLYRINERADRGQSSLPLWWLCQRRSWEIHRVTLPKGARRHELSRQKYETDTIRRRKTFWWDRPTMLYTKPIKFLCLRPAHDEIFLEQLPSFVWVISCMNNQDNRGGHFIFVKSITWSYILWSGKKMQKVKSADANCVNDLPIIYTY